MNLSKSKYVAGLQCGRRLWLELHHPEYRKESKGIEKIFAVGHEVGELARGRFPGGIMINDDDPTLWAEAVVETRTAIASGLPTLFEPCFFYEDTVARADALVRIEQNVYDLYEVKATLSVKEEHIHDLAVQTWVYEGSGIAIRNIFLMHLNRDCVFPDLDVLFVSEDVTDTVRSAMVEVPERIQSFRKRFDEQDEPVWHPGLHCRHPNNCPYWEHCCKVWNLPEKTVLDLPGLPEAEAFMLLQRGYITIDQLDTDYPLNAVARRYASLYRENPLFVDRISVGKFLSSLKEPLLFIEIETGFDAIPRYPGMKPYQAYPSAIRLWRIGAGELPEMFSSWSAEPGMAPILSAQDYLNVKISHTGSVLGLSVNRAIRRLPFFTGLAGKFHDIADIFKLYVSFPDLHDPTDVDLVEKWLEKHFAAKYNKAFPVVFGVYCLLLSL